MQPFWAALPLSTARATSAASPQVVLDELDHAQRLLAREQGRPRTEAVTRSSSPRSTRCAGSPPTAPRCLADQRLRNNQLPLRGKRSHLVRDPVGVVGVATPWSSPWTSGMRRVANALMAGNGVVLVPTRSCP